MNRRFPAAAPDTAPGTPSVLIVDASSDSREVLRTVLERLGTVILEARGAREGLELARRHQPQVIVLDLEGEAADQQAMQAAYDAQCQAHPSTLVVLGKAQRYTESQRDTRVLSKPYHYRVLVHTIEQLLQQHSAGTR